MFNLIEHQKIKISNESNVQGGVEIQGGSNMTGTDLCVNKP